MLQHKTYKSAYNRSDNGGVVTNCIKYYKNLECLFNVDNKEKGRIGLITVIPYFGLNGYTISIPLNDTQWYDLVVEKMEF